MKIMIFHDDHHNHKESQVVHFGYFICSIMNTVCLHLYGIQTPAVKEVRQKLIHRSSDLDHLTIHLHEISDYKSIVASQLASVPAVSIPQTQSFLALNADEPLDGFVARVSKKLVDLERERSGHLLSNCGLCDGTCVVISDED